MIFYRRNSPKSKNISRAISPGVLSNPTGEESTLSQLSHVRSRPLEVRSAVIPSRREWPTNGWLGESIWGRSTAAAARATARRRRGGKSRSDAWRERQLGQRMGSPRSEGDGRRGRSWEATSTAGEPAPPSGRHGAGAAATCLECASIAASGVVSGAARGGPGGATGAPVDPPAHARHPCFVLYCYYYVSSVF